MHMRSCLVWAALGQSALAGHSRYYAPLAYTRDLDASVPRQEQALTCAETYGSGSATCGDPGLKLCYNPSNGESCCGTDGGFCQAGWHCAPSPGYCCKDGDDLATCARNAHFSVDGQAEGAADDDDDSDGVPDVTPIFQAPSSTTASYPVAANSTFMTIPTMSAPFNTTATTIAPILAAPVTVTEDCNGDIISGSATILPVPNTMAEAPVSSPTPTSGAGGDDDESDDEYDNYDGYTDNEGNDDAGNTSTGPSAISQVAPMSNFTLPAVQQPPQSTSVALPIPQAAAPRTVAAGGGAWWSCVLAAAAMLFVAL